MKPIVATLSLWSSLPVALLAGTQLIAATKSPTGSPREISGDGFWARRNNTQNEWKNVDHDIKNLEWPTAQQVFGDEVLPPSAMTTVEPVDSTDLPGAGSAADKRLYSFNANGLELKAALALFAQANDLNIVPDNDVTGQVTLALHDLPLTVVMRALLEANDYTWAEEGGLIRVRATEMRTYKIDYLQLQRTGSGQNSATLTAGSGGASGSNGGGGGGGSPSGSGGGGSNGSSGAGSSSINVSGQNTIDFWKELEADLGHLLTAKGKETMAMNATAGILQVSDRPSALKRVERYLKGVRGTINEQVDIECRLYDVTLSDQFQFGVDWQKIVTTSSGFVNLEGAQTIAKPVGGFDLLGDSFTMTFRNNNGAKVVVQAMQEQGDVKVISKPRIRTLNNQTALIKVGTEMPFFTQQVNYVSVNQNTTEPITTDNIMNVTVGTILALTPQIAQDDWIALDVSPVLTSLVETKISPSRTTTAPVLDVKQASSLIRVRSGSTIIMGGLIQTESAQSRRKIPLFGDIPWLGRLFQGQFDARRKKELVIFITPNIVK